MHCFCVTFNDELVEAYGMNAFKVMQKGIPEVPDYAPEILNPAEDSYKALGGKPGEKEDLIVEASRCAGKYENVEDAVNEILQTSNTINEVVLKLYVFNRMISGKTGRKVASMTEALKSLRRLRHIIEG